MRPKENAALSLIFGMLHFISSDIFAAPLPASWLIDDQEISSPHVKSRSNDFWEIPSEEVVEELDKLYQAQGDSYDRLIGESTISNKSMTNWQLVSIRSQLAVSAQGNLGILALAGGVAAELRWFRKDRLPKRILSEDLDEPADQNEPHISIDPDDSQAEIGLTIQKVADLAYQSGKVSNKAAMLKGLESAINQTRKMIHGYHPAPEVKWVPSRFRFRVVFDASGNPVEGVRVGGDLMVRFEWIIRQKPPKPGPMLATADPAVSSYQSLVTAISQDMEIFAKRSPFGSRWRVRNFQILLGQSLSGTVGVAKLKGAYLGRLYFSRRRVLPKNPHTPPQQENSSADEPLNLIISDGRVRSSGVSSNSAAQGTLFPNRSIKISRNTFRRGLEKAEKIASFFMKQALKNQQQYWKLQIVRTDFSVGLGGGIGLAQLQNDGEIRVEYIDSQW